MLTAFATCCEYVNAKAPEKLTIPAIRRVGANRKTAKQKGKPVKRFAHFYLLRSRLDGQPDKVERERGLDDRYPIFKQPDCNLHDLLTYEKTWLQSL